MEFSRIYDEQDYERFTVERNESVAYWKGELAATGVPGELLDEFSKKIVDRLVKKPALAGVDIVHTGASPEQNFSTRLITEFVKLGIAEISGAILTIHTQTVDLLYTIQREPGRWCLHCGAKLPDDQGGDLARLHIALNHKGVPSPSENDPAGYVWLTYFECVLDPSQHEQFKKAV